MQAMLQGTVSQMIVPSERSLCTNNQFTIGNYSQAISTAQEAVLALSDNESSQPEMPLSVVITALTVTAVAGGAIGTMLFLKKKKRNTSDTASSHLEPVPQIHKTNDLSNPATSNSNAGSRAGAVFRPAHSVAPIDLRRDVVEEVEEQQDILGSLEETSIPPISSSASNSQIDRSILSRIVGNILTEKPHLRPEDQQC